VKRSEARQGGHDLGDHAVQVGVPGRVQVEVALGNVVQGLVVEEERHVGELQQVVRHQHAVVGLDHGGGDHRGGVHREGELGLVGVVLGQALEQQGGRARARSATDAVVDEEALEARALVGLLAELVHDVVDDLLAHGVVATGVVGGGVLLVGDEAVGVEHAAVLASLDLVEHGGLQVDKDAAGDVAVSDLGEEGVVRIVLLTHRLVVGVGAILLDAVLQGEQLPREVAHLDAALAESDRDNFTGHF